MPTQITSVMEIREAGILLKTGKTHIIRVLGALKEVPVPTRLPIKEELKSPLNESLAQRYYAGELAGQQEDPAAGIFRPRVPAAFVTRDGELVFLKRDRS